MFWFFEKDGERLQCEIRPSIHAVGFEIELTSSDGLRQVEHADDPGGLAVRWTEIEDRLKGEGWRMKS